MICSAPAFGRFWRVRASSDAACGVKLCMNATNSCALMDELRPNGAPHKKQIQFVKDRLGHDRRYAINA